jgi:hypothetical protein
MYLPSCQPTPVLVDQVAERTRKAACSDARVRSTKRAAACGRAQLFNTLISANQVNAQMGIGAAIDVAKVQDQSEVARATGLLATGPGAAELPSLQEIMAAAPEVVSMHRGAGCGQPASLPAPSTRIVRPSMPDRAPQIVESQYGPMHFRSAESSTALTRSGLTGYAPPWSDAFVEADSQLVPAGEFTSWIADHPWWTLALAGVGIYALSRRTRRS